MADKQDAVAPPPNPEPRESRHGLSPELKELLEFNERENQKHRDYFQMLYKWTAGSLTIIVVIIGGLVAFVGWRTVEDIRNQAQAASTEEINSIRQKSHETLERQTGQIQQQITDRLNEEFKTPAIKQTVQSAAKEQTSGALKPIITSEVRTQVTAGVRSEQQTVQKTLLAEVHQSVDDLRPTINKRVDDTVSQAVNAAVTSQVDTQITPRLKELENSAQLSTLINQAQGGDGPSFDTLVVMAGDTQVPQNVRTLALKVARSIIATHNSGLYTMRTFLEPKTEGEEAQFLGDPNPMTRKAAIDSLSPDYWKAHMDSLFTIMTSEPDLEVRLSAFNRFKAITQVKFDALDNYTASQWWALHRKDYVK